MSESNEKHERFFGTYFDRDDVLRLTRAAEIVSWVILTVYILTWIFSVILFLSQYLSGLYFAKGSETFLTLFSVFSPYLQQPLPGIFYFFGLQGFSKALLILLDMEDNTRRAARQVSHLLAPITHVTIPPAGFLGIGATAARHALDVEIGVRIPDPQLVETLVRESLSLSSSPSCQEYRSAYHAEAQQQ